MRKQSYDSPRLFTSLGLLMASMKEMLWKAIHMSVLGYLVLRSHPNSALVQNGWFRSFKEDSPVDRDDQVFLWLTYPFIHFIENRLSLYREKNCPGI
jgi:hypothetical protein